MTQRLVYSICVVLCCSLWNTAFAGDTTHSADSILLQKTPLADDDLGAQRARGSDGTINVGEFNVQISDVTQNAKLDHNVVNSSTTGNNSISNGVLSGASGIATLIQNSGNNVIIQDSTIVNYTVHQ